MKQLEVELGTGYAAAGCRACGRVFTCVTAFDAHQRLDRTTGLVCLDPATVGLVRKQSGKWGWKGDSRLASRLAHFNSGARISGVNSVTLVSSGGQAC